MVLYATLCISKKTKNWKIANKHVVQRFQTVSTLGNLRNLFRVVVRYFFLLYYLRCTVCSLAL